MFEVMANRVSASYVGDAGDAGLVDCYYRARRQVVREGNLVLERGRTF